jgi:RNA polymerase sigma-70 factor (ECF subfamily)
VNHAETAKDMLQEVFVKIFDKLPSYSNEYKFYTWAQRIALNHCINHEKKRGVDYDLQEDMTSHDIPEHKSDMDWQDMKVKQVHDSIMQLPSGYREVLSLYLLEGYDHAEISSILGISESTSKSQYSRAKHKVKQLIESNYGRSI